MKAYPKLLAAGLALAVALLGSSCTTTYDASGRPVQTMTPEGAAMGIAAAGLIGYAIGKDRDDHHYHRGHYRGGYYDRGYYRGRHCR